MTPEKAFEFLDKCNAIIQLQMDGPESSVAVRACGLFVIRNFDGSRDDRFDIVRRLMPEIVKQLKGDIDELICDAPETP